jgi:membrane-bound metal-dependent hydrolase YbcI (DUF457 family)
MDIEPLIGILRGWPVLHGHTHTVLGALVIGTIAGFIGRPISELALRLLRIAHPPFTWGSAFAGAYIGTFSHIALDAIMHADMNPFWPLLSGNPWLSAVSIETLHLICFISGGLGLALVGGQALARRHQGSSPP